jgi:hypothetical protein
MSTIVTCLRCKGAGWEEYTMADQWAGRPDEECKMCLGETKLEMPGTNPTRDDIIMAFRVRRERRQRVFEESLDKRLAHAGHGEGCRG